MSNSDTSATKHHESLKPGTETQLCLLKKGVYFSVVDTNFVKPKNALDGNPTLILVKQSSTPRWTAKNVKAGKIITISKYAHINIEPNPTEKEMIKLTNLKKGDCFEANEDGETVEYEVTKIQSGNWGWVTVKVLSNEMIYDLDPRLMVILLKKES